MPEEPARQIAIHIRDGEVDKVYGDGTGIEVLIIHEGIPGNPGYLQAHALGESDVLFIEEMPDYLARACTFG